MYIWQIHVLSASKRGAIVCLATTSRVVALAWLLGQFQRGGRRLFAASVYGVCTALPHARSGRELAHELETGPKSPSSNGCHC